MGKLDGKVAIVTGSSRGIGKDIARVFAREGAKVVVSARTENEGDFRAPGSINSTVERIKAEGGTAIGIRCDVTNDMDIEDLVRKTVAEFGRVDIMVNNAAILIPGTISEMQVRHWDLAWRVNIRGPYLGCRAVLPRMIEQGGGYIINISSGGAVGPGPGPYTTVGTGGTPYGASKAHLQRFTQGLAHEIWQHNISVNALSPGTAVLSEGQIYFAGMAGPVNMERYKGWRENGEAMGDACVIICSKDPKVYTGRIMYDNDVLREEGITDFSKYPTV